ncbi:hypothetical protein HPB47_005965 [Ixodes persulcatus]|uniref:Uncharacterized protein n=1 Tax=Ixodes persulcatus TaxID=34615 RepID=A0AC60R1S4_IXOPE|nr:hypothetical protein HPB47_005965 [Ixodes persulcatus]
MGLVELERPRFGNALPGVRPTSGRPRDERVPIGAEQEDTRKGSAAQQQDTRGRSGEPPIKRSDSCQRTAFLDLDCLDTSPLQQQRFLLFFRATAVCSKARGSSGPWHRPVESRAR